VTDRPTEREDMTISNVLFRQNEMFYCPECGLYLELNVSQGSPSPPGPTSIPASIQQHRSAHNCRAKFHRSLASWMERCRFLKVVDEKRDKLVGTQISFSFLCNGN